MRRLLVGPTVRRALRADLEALLRDGYRLGPCRLRRATFKPGRKLTGYYDVRLRGAGDAPRGSRSVDASWAAAGACPSLPVEDLEAEAIAGGLAAPFRTLHAEGQRLSSVLVSPLDARFPHLVKLSDPAYVAEALGVSPRSRYAVTTVRYRPGQRHVLRYTLCAEALVDGRPATIFAKRYEDGQGRQAGRLTNHVADWLEGHGERYGALRPLARLAGGLAELYPGVDGAPLSAAVDATGDPARAGALLHALHLAPPELCEGLDRHDLGGEVGLVARASEHVNALLPAAGVRIRDLLDRAQELALQLPGEEPTFVHGDFKLDHLWRSRRRVTMDSCGYPSRARPGSAVSPSTSSAWFDAEDARAGPAE